MNDSIFKKNPPDWKYEDIANEIEKFCDLYDKRPIKDNKGGMRFDHAFALYFILKKINPEVIIESGIFKGQSTWLIEQTLPTTKLICLDIDLSKRVYISKKAIYSDLDFKYHDFSKLPENVLVIFDDHVNHIERIREANFFKIKNIILEDNYPSETGDFQTIKQCYENYSFKHKPSMLSIFKTFYLFTKTLTKKIINRKYNTDYDLYLLHNRLRDHNLYNNEFNNMKKIFEIYYEFPPINTHKPNSEKPVLLEKSDKLKKYESELDYYNHLTYVKLK